MIDDGGVPEFGRYGGYVTIGSGLDGFSNAADGDAVEARYVTSRNVSTQPCPPEAAAKVTFNACPHAWAWQESGGRFHTACRPEANLAYMPSVRLRPTPNDCWLWL